MELKERISLLPYNTFGVEAKAKYFVEVDSLEKLRELYVAKALEIQPLLILGGGSNCLFTKDFEGLVVKMSNKGIDLLEDAEDAVLVRVQGGEIWKDFVLYCVSKGWGGVENLSLIPGTVGASPVQNIGAYGVEVKDVIKGCTAFDIATGELKYFTLEECEFAYRESVFKSKYKGRYVIVSVDYSLAKNAVLKLDYGAIKQELAHKGVKNPSVKEVSEVVSKIRVEKLPDPSTIGNAGSFFKNPLVEKAAMERIAKDYPDLVHYSTADGREKLAAGWLIEQCGWKGKFEGRVGTWKNQALVLVNGGGATGKEVFDFSSKIIDSVQQKFGVSLEREVNVF